MQSTSLTVIFLLLLPKNMAQKGKPALPTTPKGAPNFFYHDIEFRTLAEETLDVSGQDVVVRTQVLDERIWVAECRYVLEDAFSPDAMWRKEGFEEALRRKLLTETEPDFSYYEEYSIFLVSDLRVKPETFLETNAGPLARLLLRVEKPLDRREREKALSHRVRYSAEDMLVVDWNGAIAFDPDADFQPDIDLFKIAGYQLLRYRLLDQTLEDDLHELNTIIRSPRHWKWFPRGRGQLMHDIVKRQLSLLLDFEKADQSLLRIGDWYSAQLYRAIAEELFLEEWRGIVSKKLDSLRDIRAIVTEELTFSWEKLLDILQIVGWLVLLVGYFVLFYFDINA